MNCNFLDTLYLFVCGMRGLTPDISHTIDLQQIYTIATQQAIWETVFLSITRLYEEKKLDITDEQFSRMQSEFMSKCSFRYAKNAFIHNLLNSLDSNGCEPCILKGESIARFYHTPIARFSSDYDVLINPKKLDVTLDIMQKNGFTIAPYTPESHHIECRHQKVGLVEIHIEMYGKKTKAVCFNEKIQYNEPYISVTAEDGTVYKTLGVTDNMIFLFLHFLKHFISSGAGVRQLADVLLFIENNTEEIDWERVNQTLTSLGFYRFFEGMIAIGKKYFYFPNNILSAVSLDDELAEKIFSDMLLGGVFGHNDEARHGFYDIYLTERYKTHSNKNYKIYSYKSRLSRLLPDRKFMAQNYPYVEKSILLMPIAWACRIIKCILPKKKEKELSSEQQERMVLMRELGLI